MKKIILFFLLSVPIFSLNKSQKKIKSHLSSEIMLPKKKSVAKKVLSNGLTVLCCPKENASKVSVQLWYNVGSKHEGVGERGMAHFIEHMIFKGSKKLTESDINMLAHKLSAYCNAFTSYDYTAYLFDVPTANWQKVLPVLSDCMRNCNFEEEHLFSEVKAVIQELKMYRDNYDSALIEKLMGVIFEAHPYHHPIIGYKEDLWSLNRETLHRFYQKHYTPQNAALVVVGDVDPEEVFAQAEQEFQMVVDQELKEEKFFVNKEMGSKSVRLIRDVQQATGMLVFMVPGARDKKDFYIEVLESVLAGGKSSRLHKILVDEKALATAVYAFYYDLFDQGLFFIQFKPHQEKDIEAINQIIFKELKDIAATGLTSAELKRAINSKTIERQRLLELVQHQASDIGKTFFAVKDAQFVFDKYDVAEEDVKREVETIVAECLTEDLYHSGEIVQANEKQKALLKEFQEQSDAEDTAILQGKDRTSPVAEGQYVHTVSVKKLELVPQVTPKKYTLKNGLHLYIHQDSAVESVELACRHKAFQIYDPQGLEGISYLMNSMLTEGTTNRPLLTFAEELESYGMSLAAHPGSISMAMLGKDVVQGIEFFVDMVTNPSFDKTAFERVLEKTKIELKRFWDKPNQFVSALARQAIYKNHPCSKLYLGTAESLDKITVKDVVNFYDQFLSPQDSAVALVGNISDGDINRIIDLLETWQGQKIEEIKYPEIYSVERQLISHPINRDQVVLGFAAPSVSFLHEDYHKLSIFDQIFLAGGMNTRLFQLRERSGLFYTIYGSLVHLASNQPGMIFISTIVSKDRLEEAKEAIFNQIDTAIDSITDEEIAEAKEAIINTYSAHFDTNMSLVHTLIFFDKYKLDYDYFNQTIAVVRKINKDEIKEAVKKILHSDKMVCIQAGRI